MAWSFERFELADVRRFKTADFDCSRSGNLRTVFGTRLGLLFAIGSGLRCRGEKRDPVPDLLTSRAFIGSNRTTRRHYFRFARQRPAAPGGSVRLGSEAMLEALAPNGTNHSLYIRQTQARPRTAPALRFVSGNGM
jgi:hypothetical protein